MTNFAPAGLGAEIGSGQSCTIEYVPQVPRMDEWCADNYSPNVTKFVGPNLHG